MFKRCPKLREKFVERRNAILDTIWTRRFAHERTAERVNLCVPPMYPDPTKRRDAQDVRHQSFESYRRVNDNFVTTVRDGGLTVDLHTLKNMQRHILVKPTVYILQDAALIDPVEGEYAAGAYLGRGPSEDLKFQKRVTTWRLTMG